MARDSRNLQHSQHLRELPVTGGALRFPINRSVGAPSERTVEPLRDTSLVVPSSLSHHAFNQSSASMDDRYRHVQHDSGGGNDSYYASSMYNAYPNRWDYSSSSALPQTSSSALESHSSSLRLQHAAQNKNRRAETTLGSLAKKDPVRVRMQALIEYELRMRHPYRDDWQRKCNEMALQLEEVFFRKATSVEEYMDESTVSNRLVEIYMAKKMRDTSTSMEREQGD